MKIVLVLYFLGLLMAASFVVPADVINDRFQITATLFLSAVRIPPSYLLSIHRSIFLTCVPPLCSGRFQFCCFRTTAESQLHNRHGQIFCTLTIIWRLSPHFNRRTWESDRRRHFLFLTHRSWERTLFLFCRWQSILPCSMYKKHMERIRQDVLTGRASEFSSGPSRCGRRYGS